MSISKSTMGDDFTREDNIHLMKPLTGYTGAAGDLVRLTTGAEATANGVDGADLNARIYGFVLSINTDASVLSIAELKDGCRIVLPYISAPALGDAVESDNSRNSAGGVLTTRARVQTDNTNGVGRVIGVDTTSPGGTGTCLVLFSTNPAGQANYGGA